MAMRRVVAALLASAPAVYGARTSLVVEEVPPRLGLRVQATTFNAGNSIYRGEEPAYASLLEALTGGHDEDGQEADIVFLGFQEFKDDGYGFGEFAQNSALWKTMTEAKASTLRSWSEELRALVRAPAEAVEAKGLLAEDFQAFHDALMEQAVAFERAFGEGATGLQERVAEASPVQALIHGTEAEARNYSASVQRHLDAWHSASGGGIAVAEQFGNLSAATADLAVAARSFPSIANVSGRLMPIHAWRDQTLAKLQYFQESNFPNLINEEVGSQAWGALTGSVGAVQATEAGLNQVSLGKPAEFLAMITDLEQRVKTAVQEKENKMADMLLNDLGKVKEDLAKLIQDVEGSSGILKEHTTSSYKTAAKEWNKDKVLSFLKQWSTDTSRSIDQLLQTTPLQLEQSHFKAAMHVQKWASGKLCEAASHYDTILYAFVNPWSKWKILPVEYESETCIKRTRGSRENPGCNIDNSAGMDCGKIVNMMVFNATHEDHGTVRICALNTHMSFAGTAEQRMSYNVRAVEETEQAKCDAVVFVGDFNSRLHCQEYESKLEDDVPTFARKDADGGLTSFDYVLGRSCRQDDKCPLRGTPNLKADELTQMLDFDKVTCFEAVKQGMWKKKTVGWRRHILLNTLKREGLSEANVPDFAPTYKLANKAKVEKKSEKTGAGWSRCLANETLCFYNPSGGPKHNPAWADRILVRGTAQAAVETVEYSRQQIRTEFGSDHLPVRARLLVVPRR